MNLHESRYFIKENDRLTHLQPNQNSLTKVPRFIIEKYMITLFITPNYGGCC